jgi:transcriptional regulator with XRE-family HTH domain
MSLLKGIGSRIQKIRANRGITQDELGEKVGLNPKYISAIECGQRNITIKTLAKIADGLGVELFELLLFPDPPDPTLMTRKAIESLLKEADITVLRLCLQFLKTAVNT